jgi:hypothetical protein
VRNEGDDDLALHEEQIRSGYLQSKKERSVLKAVYEATGQRYTNVTELQRGYFKSLVRPKSIPVPTESGVISTIQTREAAAG